MPDTEPEVQSVEVDQTPDVLRTWGLSGEPLRWAPVNHQMAIASIREANVGTLAVAAVQPILDSQYPDAGYQAADLCLAHAPVATFTVGPGDGDLGINVALDGDADLGLPDAHVTWLFGDGYSAHGSSASHEYNEPGLYDIRCEVLVAGSVYSTSQSIQAGPEVEPIEEEYDPSAYTVDEVKAYVDENPDETDAVLAAERDGKARTTLLDWLESR